ncbi:MAG: hypothetical protein ACXW2H_07485 [Candidatus Aminicenantales bacterium]
MRRTKVEVGMRGKLRLLGTFVLLVVIIAALMAIPSIWAQKGKAARPPEPSPIVARF